MKTLWPKIAAFLNDFKLSLSSLFISLKDNFEIPSIANFNKLVFFQLNLNKILEVFF